MYELILYDCYNCEADKATSEDFKELEIKALRWSIRYNRWWCLIRDDNYQLFAWYQNGKKHYPE